MRRRVDDCEHENKFLVGRDEDTNIYYCQSCGYTLGDVKFFYGTELQSIEPVPFNEFYNQLYKDKYRNEISDLLSGYISRW